MHLWLGSAGICQHGHWDGHWDGYGWIVPTSPDMDSTKARQYDLTTVKGQLGNGALSLHPQRQVWLASSCRNGENDLI